MDIININGFIVYHFKKLFSVSLLTNQGDQLLSVMLTS